MPTNIDSEKIQQIKNSDETWVIDFWAEWCKPCQMLKPVFESVSEESEANFGKVDMEENQDIGTQFGVRALPTIIVVKNGEEVARTSGAMKEEELENWVAENT